MIDLSFDNGTVEQYTLILTTRDQNKLGQLANVRNVKYSAKLNGADELSFEVCKQLDDHEEVLWDDIYDLRLVYIKELNQYFEIRVDLVDKVYMTKIITCTALCECELSQTGLHDIEINTAEDIARPDYDVNYPTVFYRILPSDPTSDDYKKKRNSSLLHRILDKVPAYTIKHVDSSLSNLQRSFSISDTTVYDFLIGECAEQFNCLFQFDSSDRSISVYDLYTVCNTCGHRGDFNDVCPECGGTDLKYFGEDTTVFVSTENLTEEVRFETDTDSIKNTFRLEAGDDNMTAAVINSNPTGSRYIYEFSEEARKDMPSELVNKMSAFDEKYNFYNNEYEISFGGGDTITNDLPGRHPYSNNEKYSYHITTDLTAPIYIVLNPDSNTESSSYDYLTLYCRDGSGYKKSGAIGGTIAGKVYKVDSSEFWIYWQADGSHDTSSHGHWGWQIDSITSVEPSSYVTLSWTSVASPGEGMSGTFINEDDNYSAASPTLASFNNIINKYNQMTCQNCGNRGDFTTVCPVCNSTNIIKKDPPWGTIPSIIQGYKNLIPYYYECIDLYSYLKSSMMPQVVIPQVTVQGEIDKINYEFSKATFKLGLSRVNNNTVLATVNSAAVNYAKTLIKSGFVKISVDTDYLNSFTYQGTSSGINMGTWKGRFKVVNTKDESDFNFTNSFTVTVTDEYDNFIQEKIAKQILSKCDDEVYDVIKLIAEAPNNPQKITDFERVIRLYSANRLQSFHDAIEAVIGILIDAGQGNSGSSSKTVCNNCGYTGQFSGVCPSCGSTNLQKSGCPKSQLYDSFYTPYYQMLDICEAELNIRNNEIDTVWGSYDMNGYIIADGMVQLLADKVRTIHKELDFEDFLGTDLFKIFTTYIREQTYTNSNYISDGLDDNELFVNAQRFLDRAKEELHKAATYQHSIKTNLNNLLVINEFKPILNKFELGNWIRVKADDNIYRLRLISYSIDFDNLKTINTEFSDVTETTNGFNDIQSILQQASSMASTYGYTEKQAETGSNVKYDYIDKWVQDGLNSSLVRINNNNDEDIRIDEAGITARTYDDISETYDNEQLRITHNVIAFTDDNWESVKTALGKFQMHHHTVVDDNYGGLNIDPNAEDIHDEYGLVADAVLAGWIVGSYMESSTIIGSHFQTPGNSSYIDMTPSTANGRNYFIKCSLNGEDKFTVDKQGNVDIRGASFSGTNLILGGYNDNNGTIVVKDGENDPIAWIDQRGITIHKGVIQDPNGYNYWNLNTGEFRMMASTKIYDPDAKYRFDYIPTNANFPASNWSDAEKADHVGETFLNTSTNKTYIYKSIIMPETSHPYSDGERKYWHFTTNYTSPIYLIFDGGITTEGPSRIYDYITLYTNPSGSNWQVSNQIGGTVSPHTYGSSSSSNSSSSGSSSSSSDPNNGDPEEAVEVDGDEGSNVVDGSGSNNGFPSSYVAYQINANEFWMTWSSDGSNHNYYGFKVATVLDDLPSGVVTDSISWSSTSDPTSGKTWIDINLSGSAPYEWVEATIDEYIGAKTSVNMDNLTQDEIFNILTDGGKSKGLILQNDTSGQPQLYINADYIKTGKLVLGGPYTLPPTLEVRDNSSSDGGKGNLIGKWDQTGLTVNKGSISGTSISGSTISGGTISGTTITGSDIVINNGGTIRVEDSNDVYYVLQRNGIYGYQYGTLVGQIDWHGDTYGTPTLGIGGEILNIWTNEIRVKGTQGLTTDELILYSGKDAYGREIYTYLTFTNGILTGWRSRTM